MGLISRFLMLLLLLLTLIAPGRPLECQWRMTTPSLNPQMFNGSNPFTTFFLHNKGNCSILLYENTTGSLFNSKTNQVVFIRLYDMKYIDEKLITIYTEFDLNQFASITSLNRNSTIKAILSTYETFSLRSMDDIEVKYTVQGTLTSGEGTLELAGVKLEIKYYNIPDDMAYTICAIVYNMLVTVLCWRVYKSRLSAQKISLLSLYQYCILTLFIGLIELLIGIASIGHLYGLFLVYGILKILNVLLLLKKFEAIMQRVRGFWKYILCYWGIFTYFYCFVNYGFTNWFICINSLTLMPQIIHNVITCNKIGPQWSFLAVICSNQMYFIYVRGCPDNKLAYAPKPLLCYFVIIMLCLQLIIILMQNVYGPVFICKKYLLPEYHNYYEQVLISASNNILEEECPICLSSLLAGPPDRPPGSIQMSPAADKGLSKATRRIMRTPCNHRFHIDCLEEWMQIKQECPVDRNVLPPIY